MQVRVEPVLLGIKLAPATKLALNPATPASKSTRRAERMRDFTGMMVTQWCGLDRVRAPAPKPPLPPPRWSGVPYRALTGRLNFCNLAIVEKIPDNRWLSAAGYTSLSARIWETRARSAAVSSVPAGSRRLDANASPHAPITRIPIGVSHNSAVCRENGGLSRTNSP